MKLQPPDRRVHKEWARRRSKPAYGWRHVTDPRARRGRRWGLEQLLDGALIGLLSGCPTLRDVEALTDEMGPAGRAYVPRRLPDTTLWDLLPRLSAEELRAELVARVRDDWRSKALSPEGLPCGVVSIDGKGLGALEHDADGTAQKAHRPHDGSPYWLARCLRAVLVSAEARPCLDQMPIGARTNEVASFATFFGRLLDAYGSNNDLFEIVTGDAGLTSRENAGLVHDAHKAYVFALKASQPELLAEAQRLLDGQEKPDAETPWEPYQGKRVRRRLFRTGEIAGYHDWHHLRQAWRIETEVQYPDLRVERDQRYFLTNLPVGRLSTAQVLELVRRHWAIENDCFWSLDTQWNEDQVPWCSQGRAVETLSWLRLMAYHLVQMLRRRSLRRRRPDGVREEPPPWRRLFDWIQRAWTLYPVPAPTRRLRG